MEKNELNFSNFIEILKYSSYDVIRSIVIDADSIKYD
jgi:hypothetical protein